MNIQHSIYSVICWWPLGLLPLLVMNTAVCTFVYKSLYEHVFLFSLSRYLEIELLGHKIHLCLIFSDCLSVFQSYCIILHSHQWWTKVPISPHPPIPKSSIVCHDYSNLTEYEVISHCSSNLHLLKDYNSIEHIFTCLLAILYNFFGEIFIWIFCLFLIGLFMSLVLSYRAFYILLIQIFF